MSMYVDARSQLHQTFDPQFALTCPHCLTYSHITAVSVPQFDLLMRYKPKQVGIVYRCESCNGPIFLKFAVKAYAADKVELSSKYVELERPRETFNFTYIPEEIEVFFKEALSCYSTGAINAFASMCRRTAQRIFTDLGETGKLRAFDQFNDVKDMAEIDNETFSVVKRVVFDSDGDSFPMLDSAQAGVLLELMKDMLYQCYVRKGKLQQAMMVRRFFVEENASQNITSFQKKLGSE